MIDVFDMNIASALCELKETINIVLTQIKSRNPHIHNDDVMDLRLILTELLVNAIKHGNMNDIHKKVYIAVEFSEESITTKVMDEGNGFDYNKVLSFVQFDESIMAESGRGIKLVSALADELFFNSKGNEIRFVKRFNTGMKSK